MLMKTKHLILATCSVVVLGLGSATAGPCNSGSATNKDAGSGQVTVGQAQPNTSMNDTGQHPPTSTMNRASGETAASSEDAQRQMQSQPTAAQRAEGAKPHPQTADKGC